MRASIDSGVSLSQYLGLKVALATPREKLSFSWFRCPGGIDESGTPALEKAPLSPPPEGGVGTSGGGGGGSVLCLCEDCWSASFSSSSWLLLEGGGGFVLSCSSRGRVLLCMMKKNFRGYFDNLINLE